MREGVKRGVGLVKTNQRKFFFSVSYLISIIPEEDDDLP